MSNRFPIDAELVARADYAYNPRPGKDVMKQREEITLVDAGLVRKTNDAYFGADIKAADTFPYTGEQMYRMANAVRVIADALLEPVTDAEVEIVGIGPNSLNRFLAARRARLLAPAKSAEDKVADVLKRNRAQIDNGRTSMDGMIAEIIATLKQESK